MNGTGSTLTDLSGNGNTGTAYNTTKIKLPSGASSMSFNGKNSYIIGKNSPSLNPTSGLTVEVLAEASSLGATQSLVSKSQSSNPGDGYTLWLASNNRPEFIGFNRSRQESYLYYNQSLSANRWYHVVGVFDGSKLSIFVNGVKYGSTSCVGMSPSSMDLSIGKYGVGQQAFWNGNISMVRIYNRALSDSEVKNNYNADRSRVGLPQI